MTPDDQLITFACRYPNGSLIPLDGSTRQIAFCPNCQFEYKRHGCIFTPTHKVLSFGKNASTRTRREYAPRRKKTNNTTGGKWKPKDILERIVEHYERHSEWPLTTTAYRDSQALPHSSTVKRHFPGGIAEAVRQAQELLEEEKDAKAQMES